MAIFAWQDLATFDLTAKGKQDVAAPWVVAVEQFDGATHLQLIVEDARWTAMPGLPECGADGLPDLAVPNAALLLADCAPAALIGRVGGSSATLNLGEAPPEGTGKPFAVGSHCVVQLPARAVGPLFLGFNLRHRPVKVAMLKVKVSKASPIFNGDVPG
ncbi:MAG TPA: hypothetical protein VIL69_02680 [Roseomonas sp.]|jgi:hypothetical protein